MRRCARLLVLLIVVLTVVRSAQPVRADEPANEELIQMVIGFLGDSDKDVRALALDQIRNKAPGETATTTFAGQMSKLSAEAQVGLLGALADRGDSAAKPTVVEVLNSAKEPELRSAAIRALGKLGSGDDCKTLITLLTGGSDADRAAARASLVQLRGGDVSSAIVGMIDGSAPDDQVALIELLTARRALETIPTLLELSVGDDPAVRAAAMTALGKLAEPEHIGPMTRGVLAAKRGRERDAAEKNVMFVCQRIDEEDRRADELLAAMQSASPGDRLALLPLLGRVGGPAALAEVGKAIASSDRSVHAQGIRAISNWPDASVAEQLIELARSDEHKDHRRTARMALIRVAPLPDGRTDAEKLALLQSAMKLADNVAERNYALRRAAAIRLVETLRFVRPYLKQPPHAEQACLSIVELAHDRKLRDDNKPEFHAALDDVLATTKDAVVIDRAKRYKRGQTWVRPK